MKKILFLLSFFLSSPIIILAQGNYRIDTLASPWENNKDGYICLDLPATNQYSSLSLESKHLKYFSIFNIPFQIKSETAGKFSTTKEGKETISLNAPLGTHEILFVMFADFPHEESGRSWDLPISITLLDEPERVIVQLLYSDGETDEVIPVNADYKCYGISHGRSLYSIAAKNGKSIAKMVFGDNMRNASFQFLAATVNTKLLPRIALPNNKNRCYPPVKKVNLTQGSFLFDTANGISWKSIESEMLPETMNLEEQPVFMFVVDGLKISSKEWMVTNVKTKADTNIYTLTYKKGGLNLKAIMQSFKSAKNEISLSMDVINKGNNSVQGQLFLPLLSNLKIGSADNT